MATEPGNTADAGAMAAASDIPSLDRLLKDPAMASLLAAHGHSRVTATLRAHLDGLRGEARAGTLPRAALAAPALAAAIGATLGLEARPRLRTVFNLTGTVLHTNLGRAVLPHAAVRAVVEVMTAPVAL